MNQKKKTVVLGLVFTLLLFFAYTENSSFFGSIGEVFANPLLAILFVFVHNVLVISLILLGMTFYVGLVLNFLADREEEHVIINNPRIFAFIFTLVVIFFSILRASTLVYGQVVLNTLFFAILLSTPNAILEGYGLYQTIKRTLNRKMTTNTLLAINLLFNLAPIIEVGYVYLLRATI